MKYIKTVDAVGHVLCHDMTQIIPGKYKGPAFKKGKIVTVEDIEVLLSMGKENLYIWEVEEGVIHEDEAAVRLGKLCKSEGMSFSEVHEGKISILASEAGLLKINKEKLEQINNLKDIIIATRHGNFPVEKGQILAGTRIIPLVIEEANICTAEAIAGDTPIMEILPYKYKKAGVVTTGSEIYYNRIKDAFGPIIIEKLKEYDVEVIEQIIVDDDKEAIKAAIYDLEQKGAEIVLCTGGMSVDPDDVTPSAIEEIGADIVSYGAPVLPGAMFLLAYHGDVPVMGLPGCVMYAKRTVFDLVLPRVLAGDQMELKDINAYGHGGLCLNCEVCTYPNCGFGKG